MPTLLPASSVDIRTGSLFITPSHTREQLRVEARQLATVSREDFLGQADVVIRYIARCRDYLTSDDVWTYLDKPEDPRWIGLAFLAAARDGIIRKTQITRSSRQDTNHGRDVRVWESLIR